MRNTLFWVITRREEVTYYRRFGVTYRYHPSESKRKPVAPIRSSHLLSDGSLKSRKMAAC
jgi:hypothetical protein